VPAGILADVHHVAVMSQAECARDGLRTVVVTTEGMIGSRIASMVLLKT